MCSSPLSTTPDSKFQHTQSIVQHNCASLFYSSVGGGPDVLTAAKHVFEQGEQV